MVKQFVTYFYRHIRERHVPETWSMYDVSFPKLSDRYFKQGPWPSVDAVSSLVDHDHVFCLLYRELYYRHLYSRTTPTLEDRTASYDTYEQLFRIAREAPVNMVLPSGWLWDMVDEFCAQYHSFHWARGRAPAGSGGGVGLRPGGADDRLARAPASLWAHDATLAALNANVERSGVVAELMRDGGKARRRGIGPGGGAAVLAAASRRSVSIPRTTL